MHGVDADAVSPPHLPELDRLARFGCLWLRILTTTRPCRHPSVSLPVSLHLVRAGGNVPIRRVCLADVAMFHAWLSLRRSHGTRQALGAGVRHLQQLHSATGISCSMPAAVVSAGPRTRKPGPGPTQHAAQPLHLLFTHDGVRCAFRRGCSRTAGAGCSGCVSRAGSRVQATGAQAERVQAARVHAAGCRQRRAGSRGTG